MIFSNAIVDGSMKRGVLYYFNDCTVTTKLAKHFEHGMGDNDYNLVKIMDLPDVPDNKSGTVIAFHQNDITKNGKQYQPDMIKFLNTL